MEKLRSFIQLIRLERAISAMFGVVLIGVIVGDLRQFEFDYLIACIVVFFSAIASFSLNDFHDKEIDIINNRQDRPLAQDKIEPRTALWIAVISSLLAVSLSLLLNPIPRLMILVGLPLSLAYNFGLKRHLALKNTFTGFANVGVAFLGALVTDAVLEPLAVYIAVIAFFFSLSYEVMLDIADIKGDQMGGVSTLPGRFGLKGAAWFSILIGLGAVLADPLPFFINVDQRLFGDYLFLALILLPVINRIRISRSLLSDHSPENVFILKKRLFRNLQLGGLIYLIGFLF